MSRLPRWFLVIALLISMGLPWACLQSVAWVNMVVSYSQETSFIEALGMTFDGRHPCKICKAVTQREKKTQSTVAKTEKQKLSWTLLGVDKFIPATLVISMVQEPLFHLEKVFGRPPTPPPKQVS